MIWSARSSSATSSSLPLESDSITINRSEAKPVIHYEEVDFLRSRSDFYHLSAWQQIMQNITTSLNSCQVNWDYVVKPNLLIGQMREMYVSWVGTCAKESPWIQWQLQAKLSQWKVFLIIGVVAMQRVPPFTEGVELRDYVYEVDFISNACQLTVNVKNLPSVDYLCLAISKSMCAPTLAESAPKVRNNILKSTPRSQSTIIILKKDGRIW